MTGETTRRNPDESRTTLEVFENIDLDQFTTKKQLVALLAQFQDRANSANSNVEAVKARITELGYKVPGEVGKEVKSDFGSLESDNHKQLSVASNVLHHLLEQSRKPDGTIPQGMKGTEETMLAIDRKLSGG